MKKILLLLLLAAIIIPMGAMAEVLTGTLGSDSLTQTTYSSSDSGTDTLKIQRIYITNIQYSGTTQTVINFLHQNGAYDAGAPPGSQTTFTATLDGIAGPPATSGVIGYQRIFNLGGTELPGYFFVTFNSWNITGITGNHFLYLTYDTTAIYNASFTGYGGTQYGYGDGNMIFFDSTGGGGSGQDYIRNSVTSSRSSYTIEKPSGLGISGQVIKSLGNSRIFIVNGSSPYEILTSESTMSNQNVSINTGVYQVQICMLDQTLTWYNSSVLFAAGPAPTPTGTPTPATTPVPTPTFPPVAEGLVRTIVINIDGNYGTPVTGSNINLRDHGTSTWANSTNDADGTYYIDVLPSHTIDVYGSATGYSPTQEIGAAIGGTYRNPLYALPLSPGTGNVHLFVSVYNQNGMSLQGVSIQSTLPTGATTIQVTNGGGTTDFVVPNNTFIHLYASKAGYTAAQATLQTPTFDDTQQRITLTPDYIPVTTSPPIGYTTVPTYAPNCNPSSADYDVQLCADSQNADLMLLVQQNGPTIVNLAIQVIIISLLGLMGAVLMNFGK